MFVIEPPVCDNRDGSGGAGNTIPSLTHPLDSSEGGLAMKATRICSIEGCEKPYYARGYCRAHRAKALRSGELTPRVPATECSIEGCANKPKSRGWCKKHYSRWAKTGDVNRGKQPKRVGCEIEGCERPHAARGLCKMHDEWARNPDVKKRIHYESCQVAGCEKPNNGCQFCPMHYSRLWRTGTTDSRPEVTRYVDPRGYVTVKAHAHPLAEDDGWAYEHRVVLYNAIGPGSHPCNWCRETVTWGVDLHVDHLDENKSNNDSANLVPSCDLCNRARSSRWTNQRCGGCDRVLAMPDRIARVNRRWVCTSCGEAAEQ